MTLVRKLKPRLVGCPTGRISWWTYTKSAGKGLSSHLIQKFEIFKIFFRYTCEARNEAGKASADFEVDIFIKPRFRDLKPTVRVRDGERTRLECKVDGHPEPAITYDFLGRIKIFNFSNLCLIERHII